MMGIASIYCFSLYQIKLQNKSASIFLLLLSVLLTALAVFSKQSGIQFIIIFGGFSLLNKDWKTLGKIIISSLFIYGGFALVFRFLYPSFFQNVIGGVINGIDLKNFISFIITKNIFIVAVWPLILVTLFIFVRYNTIFKGFPVQKLLSVCALGTLVFATATALKMGSTVQYYIVFVNLSLLIIMKSITKGPDTTPTDQVSYRDMALYLYLVGVVLIFAAQNAKLIKTFDHNPTLELQRNAAVKTAAFIEQDRIKNSGRYIFANLTTDYTIASRQSINNILYKICLVPEMDILEYSTGPSKVIGYKNLEDMLSSGEVEYLIESKPKSKFAILPNLESIRDAKFKLIKEIDGYLVYKFSSN